ncbi:MAG: hypothetical protein WCC04_14490 [Terriglobales bacterium]
MATLRLVLGFAVFALVGLVCLKLIPPFFSNYELEDAIKTDALQATYSTRSEEDIRTAVIKHARDYDIELTPKQVHVTRVGSFGNGTLTIEADYSVPLDFPGYSTSLDFHPSSNNRGVF